MEIVISGNSGELADFTERMIGVRDVSSQKPYEAKPGYVPLRDFQALVKAARGANRDTAQKEPSTGGGRGQDHEDKGKVKTNGKDRQRAGRGAGR